MTVFRVEGFSQSAAQPRGATPPTGQPPVPTVGTSNDDSGTPPSWLACPAIAAVIGTAFLVAWLIKDPHYPGSVKPIAGLSVFALFYVTAQALERLLEPISGFIPPTTTQSKKALTTAATTATDKVKIAAAAAAVPGSTRPSPKRLADQKDLNQKAQNDLDAAAKAQAKLNQQKTQRALVFWMLASGLGIWAAAALKLYFLHTVGIDTSSRTLELLATGLIIGAGTKPLHDLITTVSKTASSKSATATA